MTEGGAPAEPGFEPVHFKVPVADGDLYVARWGEGKRAVLGVHGVTASSMALLPVARRLGPEITLVAPDLRGRGGSASLPGPYGLQAHARDCAAVIEGVAEGRAIVLGESMGAYVAVVLAATRPDLVERLVLVDGGLPLPLPEEFAANRDIDALMTAALGPALARLSIAYPTRDAYLDFWKAHPAFKQDWSADVEAYLDYDLEPVEGGFRSRVRADAVLADSRDVAQPDLTADALMQLSCDVVLLRAPRDLLDRPSPLIPEPVVAEWQQRLPNLSAELVDDVNHYTLMFGERGTARIAALVGSASGPAA